jgi:hypothetical protein
MISSKVSFQDAFDAVQKFGSRRAAAKELGVDEKTVRRALKRVTENPDITDPDHQIVRRSRLQKTPDGIEWVITERAKGQNPNTVRDIYKAIADEYLRPLPLIEAPAAPLSGDDLLNVYTITDFHLGAMALKREGGADWDMDIAEKTLRRVYRAMLDQAPNTHTCVVAQLGDLLHWDGLAALTPTSGHLLDASTRFPELCRVAGKLMVWLVREALKKHQHVHVLAAEGNHDLASSAWLRTLLGLMFEDNPRVTVDESQVPYYAYEWGKTGLVWHHGHLTRPEKLASVAASMFREMWGRCPHMYGHMGDKHHFQKGKDDNGMTVLQHTTLTARDSYTSRHGWFSERAASAYTYSKQWGEVGFVRVTPDMVGCG